jgi:DNA-binding transcriptional regulator YhcF (GntR family)
MDNSTAYFFLSILGIIIWVAILQAIIASSTRTKERISIAKDQLNILVAVATKLGVTEEEVQNILTPKSKEKVKGRFW